MEGLTLLTDHKKPPDRNPRGADEPAGRRRSRRCGLVQFRAGVDWRQQVEAPPNYNVALMRATIAILFLSLIAMSAIAAPPIDFAKLTKDQVVGGFRVDSVYLNDAYKA